MTYTIFKNPIAEIYFIIPNISIHYIGYLNSKILIMSGNKDKIIEKFNKKYKNKTLTEIN